VGSVAIAETTTTDVPLGQREGTVEIKIKGKVIGNHWLRFKLIM
jgi:hypothetical protein